MPLANCTQQQGHDKVVSATDSWCRWAIEYESPAADAFKLNHPHAAVFAANCNVILAAAMSKAGQQACCAASEQVGTLPQPSACSSSGACPAAGILRSVERI